jgi:hypothetical protein
LALQVRRVPQHAGSVDVQSASSWHDFFLGMSGASAALSGLLLVALSLHPARTLSMPLFRARALGILAGMIWVAIVSLIMLVPVGFQAWAITAEVLIAAVGVVSLGVMTWRLRLVPGSRILPPILGIASLLVAVTGGLLMLTSSAEGGPMLIAAGMIAAMLNWCWSGWNLIVYTEPNSA